MDPLVFGWIDYAIFVSSLVLSLFVGCYFGFCSKQDSTSEYLFGGKKMGYIPVSISTLASLISGITFLGLPTEVYQHGCQYIFTVFSNTFNGLATVYIFMPVFFKLQVASTFEYLELRFSRKVRIISSTLYSLSLLVYIPIVIYVPSLAFSQVTGINLHTIAPVISIICIAYTSIGGVKAVIWTDTIQFVFTIVGLITILVVGTRAVGGFSKVWTVASAGKRLDIFDFNLSPFVRTTVWGMTVGSFFNGASNSGIGQKFVQRYLSIGNEKDIAKALFIKTIGTISTTICVIFSGLLIYARYYDCDPISAKMVERDDRIVPYYVLDITKNLPGVSGIFLAGIVSSALSTMSASVNTLSGIIYEDFIDRWVAESPNKDSKAANIMKVLSVIIGAVSITLIFTLDYMGTVLEMSYIRGAVDGPLLGFILLGLMCPWVGKNGALTGGCVSVLIMLWIVIGNKWNEMNHKIRYSKLPMSVENCPQSVNTTFIENVTLPPLDPDEEPLLIFKLSFLYFVLVGAVLTVIIGSITSILIKESNLSEIDPDHITPICQRFLPKKKYEEVPIKEMLSNQSTMKENIDR